MAAGTPAERPVLRGKRPSRPGAPGVPCISGCAVVLFFLASLAFAAGIFRSEQAAESDPLLAYNRACTLVAAGKLDDAVESLQTAATAREERITTAAQMLLADIAVRRARDLLGEEPLDAAPPQRSDALEHLAVAENWYEPLLADATVGSTARRNLERLRLWKASMKRNWADHDRLKRLEAGPLAYLKALDDEQRGVRKTIQHLAREPESPRRSQAFYLAAKEQRSIAESLPPLREALREPAPSAVPTVSQATSSSESSTEISEAMAEAVNRDLDGIEADSQNAVERLARFEVTEALALQTRIVERMDRLRAVLTPYEPAVRETLDRQEALLRENQAAPSASGEQGLLETWVTAFLDKARRELDNREGAVLDPAPTGEGNVPADSGTETPRPSEPLAGKDDPLYESMTRASRYGDEIQGAMRASAADLERGDRNSAIPKQETIVALLREILEPLQREQKDGGEQKDKENGSPQNGPRNDAQNEREPNPKGDRNEDSESPRPPSPSDDREPQSDQEKEEQEKTRGGDPSEKQPSGSPHGTDRGESDQGGDERERREQAERMIRQARRRQYEADRLREQIRILLQQSTPVEKDW